MADTRGRRAVGGFLGDYWQPSSLPEPAVGQPNMPRMQGVPTMPGYRDRIPKWNAFILPLLVYEFVRHLLTRWKA